MGCDFYIRIYLEIHHNNGISYYEFPTMRGYYCELDGIAFDSDNDNDNYNDQDNSMQDEYETLYENIKRYYLTPRKPVVIYNNNSFLSSKCEMKYLPNIQDKINNKNGNKYCRYQDTGTFTSIEQVITVIKKEERYEPM